jgi:hypothetical protein
MADVVDEGVGLDGADNRSAGGGDHLGGLDDACEGGEVYSSAK